jgi:hypothetical protein
MRPKRILVVLAIAGTTVLTGCGGDNLDLDRGEDQCQGSNLQSGGGNCGPTGTPDPAGNT